MVEEPQQEGKPAKVNVMSLQPKNTINIEDIELIDFGPPLRIIVP